MAITLPETKSKEEAVVAKAVGMTLKGKKKLKAVSLDESQDAFRLLVVGHTGSGKTLTLAKALETKNDQGEPTKIFVASTDIGGDGLRTVKEYLKSIGRPDLLPNLAKYHFRDYEDFAAFTTDANNLEVNGKPFWEFNPDILAWDGVANFQESHVWRYIMSLDPLSRDSTESRDAGVQAGQAEWGQIRKTTTLQIDQFASLQNPNGKQVHKIVTCLLDSGKESKLTKETQQGPLIMGAARDYMGPAYDMIVTASGQTPPGAKEPTYKYTCQIGGKYVAKMRGLLPPKDLLDKADFKGLWEFLTGKSTGAE